MHINDLLKIAVERKASDLHLKVGAFPVIRIDGALTPLADMRRLMQEDTIAMAFSIMSARQKEKFKNNMEIYQFIMLLIMIGLCHWVALKFLKKKLIGKMNLIINFFILEIEWS